MLKVVAGSAAEIEAFPHVSFAGENVPNGTVTSGYFKCGECLIYEFCEIQSNCQIDMRFMVPSTTLYNGRIQQYQPLEPPPTQLKPLTIVLFYHR